MSVLFSLSICSKRSQNFISILETIKDIPIVDANIKIGKTGLSLKTMDASHISLLDLKLTNKYFDTYICNNDDNVIGINLICLVKILKCGSREDSITLTQKSNSDYLDICIKNNVRSQEFNCPLMNLMSEDLTPPEKEYDITYAMRPDFLATSLQNISVVEGDTITLNMGNNNFTLISKGDLGTTKIVLCGTDNLDNLSGKENSTNYGFVVIEQPEDNQISSMFTLHLFKNISKSKSFSKKKVFISLEKDFPLKISYQILENSYLNFHLAPKIE